MLHAQPIALSDGPILDSAAVPPNIMFLIDSSGSMGTRLPNSNDTRLEVAQDAAITLIDALTDVRVGLAIFNGNDGARILVGIDDIEDNRRTLTREIESIRASGNTPLAESLQQIGRYFVQGHDGTLVLYPEQDNETRKSAYTVFDRTPAYERGVNQQSPIQYYCQKSFVLMLTDGEPTQDRDISASSGLQDYDNDCASREPPCENAQQGQPALPSYDMKPPGSGYTYSSTGSDYLDDVANALFDIDLRPDLIPPEDVVKKNNVATYPIGFAAAGLRDNPLMQDTADNGGGQYLYADDADSLVAAFNSAAAAILTQISTAASVAFSTISLTTDSAAYLVQYNTNKWSGNLVKVNLTSTGEISGIAWEAASILDNTLPGSRLIFTYNRDTASAVNFKTLRDLSLEQIIDLSGGFFFNRGQERIDYLRGDRSLEGRGFRVRDSVFGDVINSSPVVVSEPDSNWPDTAPFPTGNNKYSLFKSQNEDRAPVVYVGANDGMLHGFDGGSGQELMAYIPSSIFSINNNEGLHYLTDPDYEHRFYVDLTPTVADAYIKTNGGGTADWHTVLIGGNRNGGRGYFALDVTNPNQFSAGNINNTLLWEFTSRDDARLGKTYSQPVIGLMNNGRWAAIFGNGYNATGTNDAQLFIVYLDGGENGEWQEGRDYIVIDTEQGNLGNPNGLTSPGAVDLDGNGTIDRIYAGDLDGMLWAFDVSSSSSSNWQSAYGNGGRPKPLFNAPNNQSVTTRVTVVKNPNVGDTTGNAPNTIVMFGTGKLLAANDKFTTTTESFYGIWDHGDQNIQRNKLLEQTYQTTGNTRTLTDNTINYQADNPNQSDQGWYIDFVDGERIITNPATRGGFIFFNTTIPTTDSPCSFGGSGWLMVAKVENGGQPSEAVFDVNNDDQLDDNDKINDNFVSGLLYEAGVPAESSFLADQMYTATSSGEIDKRKIIDSGVKRGRISWKEIQRN
ncbi:MAG: hypothetical protein CMF49_04750 [Legionellales bacterium]|nr:hypothetical protein [Legionellales bacterium]